MIKFIIPAVLVALGAWAAIVRLTQGMVAEERQKRLGMRANIQPSDEGYWK